MKQGTYYFSHDYNVRSDYKIKRLISTHGYLGYGIYWALVEDLYNNSNRLLTDYKIIARDLNCDEKIVKSVVEDFNLFVIRDNEFYSDSIARRLKEIQKKRKILQKNAKMRWQKNNANAMQLQSKSNAIAMQKQCNKKKRKENKRKENKINKININKDTNTSNPSDSDLVSVVNKWNNFAKNHNLPQVMKITDRRKSGILNRLLESEFDFDKILDKIQGSDFLLGKSSDWRVDFDFVFLSRNNYIKILEGKYDKKVGSKPIPKKIRCDECGEEIFESERFTTHRCKKIIPQELSPEIKEKVDILVKKFNANKDA